MNLHALQQKYLLDKKKSAVSHLQGNCTKKDYTSKNPNMQFERVIDADLIKLKNFVPSQDLF